MKPVIREADIIGRTYAITAFATPIHSEVWVQTGGHTVIGTEPAAIANAATLALDLDAIAARLLLTAIRTTLAEARRRALPPMWSVAS